MTEKEFSKRLRRVINSNKVFSLLEEGDWGAGGCWTLAAALKKILGAPAKLYAVVSDGENVQHVVVKHGDLYIDYNGVQTKNKLFNNLLEEGYYNPQLEPFDKELQRKASKSGIPCDVGIVKKLINYLREEFES